MGTEEADPVRVEWLERLAAATETAMARLHGHDDPAHAALLDDLEAFRERLVAELGR